MTDADASRSRQSAHGASVGDRIVSNPFSTRHVQPGALPYLFPPGEDASSLVARLQTNRGWGEIVGPHGSGKSTLLAALLPQLQAAGWQPLLITLHDGERSLSAHRGKLASANDQTLIVIDGYEQLSRWHRWRLCRFCRRRNSGLLITAHRPLGLPRLAATTVNPGTALAIVERLAPGEKPIDQPGLAQLLSRHGGNFREVLFDLYDMHELRGRN